MAVYDDTAAEERIRVHDKAALRAVDGAGAPGQVSYHYGPVTSPVVKFDEPLAVQAKHFVECLTTGSQPRTDGANGLAVVQVIEAAQLSLAKDRRVLLEEVMPDADSSRAAVIPMPRRSPVGLRRPARGQPVLRTRTAVDDHGRHGPPFMTTPTSERGRICNPRTRCPSPISARWRARCGPASSPTSSMLCSTGSTSAARRWTRSSGTGQPTAVPLTPSAWRTARTLWN